MDVVQIKVQIWSKRWLSFSNEKMKVNCVIVVVVCNVAVAVVVDCLVLCNVVCCGIVSHLDALFILLWVSMCWMWVVGGK